MKGRLVWIGKSLGKLLGDDKSEEISQEEKDHWKRFNATFDSAKRLSDFIGMIIRLSFAQFAAVYFIKKAPEAEGLLSITFAAAGVMATGIWVRLAMYVARIIMLYETRDAHIVRGTFPIIIYYLLSGSFALASFLGMYQLVGELASASVLLGAP